MTDWQDDGVLVDQYEDASNLAARQVLAARFSTSDRSRFEWLFDQFDCPADADVLAVGAGHGALWTANADRIPDGWDVTVTDAFQGMVMDAMDALDGDADVTFDVVDAREVPYPDNSFDAVTAHRVLSHLNDADLDTALEELERVLRPGGTLYAATTGDDHLADLWDAAAEFGDPPEPSFSLDDGDRLREHFETVECREFAEELVVDSPEPLVAYVLSLPGFDPADGLELERAFRYRMDDGELRLGADLGVFVATTEA
jgi:SAM-dependent methyltransferase